jgi:hypothetical protein
MPVHFTHKPHYTCAEALPEDSPETGYEIKVVDVTSTNSVRFSEHQSLANSSGTATYSATFDFSGGDNGMILDLGTCLHTCNASINGNPTKPINLLDSRIDITDLLEPGVNTLEIEISTPLGNFLR